jgi:hypothetical protein
MKRFLHPLLLLLARATEKELVQTVEYLKTENRILRGKLPRRIAEAWVQRTKHEVLNHFVVFGEIHLRHILAQWLIQYHRFRPHQGLGNVPIGSDQPPPDASEDFRLDDIVCHASFGGLLKHYERRAA